MDTLQEKYFELFFNIRITEYKNIDEYRKWPIGKAKDTYNSLDQFFCEEMKVDQNKLNEVRQSFEEYKSIYDKYNNDDRREMFLDHDKLLAWYKSQLNINNEAMCAYCGITQGELEQLVTNRGGNLTLNNKTKRSLGTIEIEKKDSDKSYTYENSIMACPLCNNAKSNLISEQDWRAFFVEPMKRYYKKELK